MTGQDTNGLRNVNPAEIDQSGQFLTKLPITSCTIERISTPDEELDFVVAVLAWILLAFDW